MVNGGETTNRPRIADNRNVEHFPAVEQPQVAAEQRGHRARATTATPISVAVTGLNFALIQAMGLVTSLPVRALAAAGELPRGHEP